MANDLNVWTGIGRATKEAEIKMSSSGLAIAKFSIAVNGWKKDDVSFFDCTMFGNLAENVGKYITKGKQLAIQGSLKQDKWKDREGNNRYSVGIIVNNLQLLGGGTDSQVETMFKSGKDESFDEDLAF